MRGDRSARGKCELREELLEPRPARAQGQLAQILGLREEEVIEADVGRVLVDELARDGLAVEALLQVVEGLNGAVPDDQKLAIGDAAKGGEGLDDVGEARGDVVAGAREQPRRETVGAELHPDAVPFPFGGKGLRIECRELAVLDRVRQHQWTEHRGGAGLGARTPPLEPAEDRLIGRGGAVPDLFDLGDVDAAMGGERGLGEAGRDADPQRAGHELEKGEAALGVEAVEPAADERRRVPGGGRQQRRGDRGEPGRGQVAAGAVGPEQRHGLGAVADIVARQAVQHRIDEGRDELGEDAAVGEAQRQAVGEDGQGIAAVGIGGGAEIVGR